MESARKTNSSSSSLAGSIVRVLLPIAVLVGGYFAFTKLSVEPEKPKRPPEKARLLKTRVIELEVVDFRTQVEARGALRPHNEASLTLQVGGRVIAISPFFEDGAFFEEGEVLLTVDPADYETAVITAEAALARAESAFAQEETRARQARRNWEELGYEDEPSDLVLRKPQLKEAEANVKSAAAQLERARRDRDRTELRAPFDGRVRQRTVGLGQQVGPGSTLGTVFAIAIAEVRLPLSARDRSYLQLPESPEDPPVDIELRDVLDPENETVWTAQIVRTEGTLDAASLELYAIARIADPFGRESGQPPLRIGQPVRATIPGKVLEDVVVIPRDAVKQLDRISIVDPETLTLDQRQLVPLWADTTRVVIRDAGIPSGTLLATSHLLNAPRGAKVEILPDDPIGEATLAAEEGDETDVTSGTGAKAGVAEAGAEARAGTAKAEGAGTVETTAQEPEGGAGSKEDGAAAAEGASESEAESAGSVKKKGVAL